MKKLLRSTLVGLVFLAANTASAQIIQSSVQFQSFLPNSSSIACYGASGCYYVGPFSGTLQSLPGQPTIDLYCLDFANHVGLGQTWVANIAYLTGSLATTRGGDAKVDQYKMAAWLTTQYAAAPSSWAGIQSAIWQLFNPGNPDGGAAENSWVQAANNFKASAAWNTFDFSGFSVVTDMSGQGLQVGGTQEFLTTFHATPEPSTYILLGTGLLVVFLAVRYRVLA